MVRLAPLALLVAVAAALAGCASLTGAGDRPEVVATTTQLGDVVRRIAGPAVDVHQILRPNTDPHEYEPRPRDVTATGGAQVVFLSGHGLDHWMGRVIEEAGGAPRVVTPAARAAGDDPHWWHDPRNVVAAIPVIRDALSRADPAHRAGFTRRAAAYARRVRALDRDIARCLDAVPSGQRRLVTDHDAFGPFARRYGIDVVGAVIPSQSTEAQPSAGDLARLSALVRREHVRAIFPESSVSTKLARALAAQTGARADLTLYGDTLGPAGSRGATYLGMEEANADAMLRGFTGSRRRCAFPGV